jgi:hypothetical protein
MKERKHIELKTFLSFNKIKNLVKDEANPIEIL